MSFISSTSGRACLHEWDRPLTADDIFALLRDLKQARALAGEPVLAIIVAREILPVPPSYLRSCLQATLPALLDCCEQLVVVVEGGEADRDLIRAAFRTASNVAKAKAPIRLFDSLGAAFTHTQRAAPHDVLELQRFGIRRSSPPH